MGQDLWRINGGDLKTKGFKFFTLQTEKLWSIKNLKIKIQKWEVFNRQLSRQDVCLNFLEPDFQRNLTSAMLLTHTHTERERTLLGNTLLFCLASLP